jgi:hypothetical protein
VARQGWQVVSGTAHRMSRLLTGKEVFPALDIIHICWYNIVVSDVENGTFQAQAIPRGHGASHK